MKWLQWSRGSSPRRAGSVAPARVHLLALAGGIVTLALGGIGWWVAGGPASIEELVVVVDFTVGGTVLCTGALVGRARAGDQRRNAQLEVLQAAAKRMSSSLARTEVARTVVEETRRIIEYDNARVYVFDGPDELAPIAFEGREAAYEHGDPELLRVKLGQGFTGWVARHGTAIRIDDACADPRGVQRPGTGAVDESMLVVPMQHDDRLVGVITLSKLGLRQFDDDDLRVLLILADQAATAFSGAELLDETRRLAAELRLLLDMSSALSRSLDPHDVADIMAHHLARAVGADGCMVSDWDEADDRLRTLGTYPPDRLADAAPYYALADFPATRAVLADQEIAVIDADDPGADPAEVALLREEGARGLLMVPLVAKDRAIGLVELFSRGRPTRDAGRITLVRTMAHEAAMALENARSYVVARDLADHDPLTGFFNHRYLHERLSEELVRAVRTRQRLAVLMIDLDDFKFVNDTFGHLYGDRVLAHVAGRVRATLRASDVAARYGGDEFVVILPDTDMAAARTAADRIAAALRDSPFSAGGRQPFPVGASIGIASHPEDGRTPTELLTVADAALYKVKAAGDSIASPAEPSGPPISMTAPPAGGRPDSRALVGPVGSGDA